MAGLRVRQMSLDCLLPIALFPLALFLAAQGVWTSVVTFTFLPLLLTYSHFIYTRLHSPTYFFFVWTLSSLFFLFGLFQFVAVDLLEIRKDENCVLIVTFIVILCLMYKVKDLARRSEIGTPSEEPCSQENLLLCSACNLKVPPRTFHCYICQTCILHRDLHCAWLNCCIGRRNHRWYVALLLASLFLMLLYSNLILTTACHPFTLWAFIMLPDDCSEAYVDIFAGSGSYLTVAGSPNLYVLWWNRYSLCFVAALCCLGMGAFILALLLHEFCLVSLGMTGHEWRNRGSRTRCLGLVGPRPFSRGCLGNWIFYLKGQDSGTAVFLQSV